MSTRLTRRHFLATTAACAVLPSTLRSAEDPPSAAGPDLPLVDLHVHLDNSTIDQVVELAKERGVKFGIVEHAGTKENEYPVVLSNDTELKGYLAMLEGKPVYRGIQAEWTDWMGCFSRGTLAQLDYVLTDTMTFPGKDGQRVKLWLQGVDAKVDMADPEAFMDRYVDWHVEIMAREPIDILANLTWLPGDMLEQWERYWTAPRMKKVINAAVEYGVALEISSSFKVPRLPFLTLAKAAGAKFSFGSNGRYPNMGKLDYSLQMARAIDLKPADMFAPAGNGLKAVQRRKY